MSDEYPDVKLLWEAFLADFNAALDAELKLLDFDRKSPLTAKIKDADHRMDSAISGLRLVVSGFLHNSNPEKAEAARLIYDRLNTFKSIRTKPIEEESADVKVLVQELYVRFKNEIALLSITEWVNELEAARVLFDSLFDRRNTEWAGHTKETMREARTVTENIFYGMADRLDSEITLNGDTKYKAFVLRLNEQIKYYNEHAHHPEHHDIAKAVAVPIPVQTYTGKAITPIPEVHYVEEGKPTVELVFAVDFTVTYKDNVNVGDAELTIHGKGAYKGKKTVTFNIAIEN
jgi:hypothetical protein